MGRKQQTRREKMSEQEKEVRFEKAVDRLDEKFALYSVNEMTQEEYDWLYKELVKKFEMS